MCGVRNPRLLWLPHVRVDDPSFYGDRWAGVYDEQVGRTDPGPAAEFLAGLAGGGRVLELAIGTGRVALPLAAAGPASWT